MSKKKWGLLCGDFHCGHLVGLTPPEYQHKYVQNSTTKRNKWYMIAEELWASFDSILKSLPPLDFVVLNGDLIEGKGIRSGGTELITSSMEEQSNMAVKIIQHIRHQGKKGMKTIATFGCLAPGHKVLTADLRWVNVETLKKGDRLLAFNEKKDRVSNRRYYCESIVIGNNALEKECFKLFFSDGTSIICSHDHQFLNNCSSHNDYRWIRAGELYRKKEYCEKHGKNWSTVFRRIFDAWERDKKHLRLINIVPVGIQRVCGLGTTSKTYIADGFLCHNTDYHTCSLGDEWENVIAKEAQIDKIGAHEWLNVNGLILDVKHHIGRSNVPHGRHTASAREGVWNDMWSLMKLQPRADIIVRSHVHYYQRCETSNKICIILPALQGMGSRYGAKRCSGMVDWGVVLIEIADKNDFHIYPIIKIIQSQMAKAVRL